MAGKHSLHAVKDAHEEHVAFAGDLVPGLHHETDDAGRSLAQGAAGLVGHIARGSSGFEDAPAFVLTVRKSFAETKRVRPEAVRSNSKEFFLVCTGFKPGS